MNLILGTAEFNPQGYSYFAPLSDKEKVKILACAKEGGINIIDTAESYNCHSFLKKEAKGFCIYTKTRDWRINLDWGNNELRGILYHYQPNETPIKFPFIHRWVNLGASVYDIDQVPEPTRILQIPFNLDNVKFRQVFGTHRTVFVRSVFGCGELLKTYSVAECLWYVKQYRPDGVIVGVRSSKELEAILKEW